MGTLVRASFFGAIAGIVAFIGIAAANALLSIYGLAFLRDGGGGFNLLWLGALPCLIAAFVAAKISGVGIVGLLGAVLLGVAGGLLTTWVVFGFLAGMQGLNPLIFSGPFCAAIIAAFVGMRRQRRVTNSTSE
jgi:hypothetical protein